MSEIRTMTCNGLRRTAFCFAAILIAVPSLRADETISFEERVLPLLKTKCISCHGEEKQEGGLRLDSLEHARTGGDRGPAIVPGKAKESLLVESITFLNPDLQMPPKQQLSEEEIATLTQWVNEGATWQIMQPSDMQPEVHGDAFSDPDNPIRKLFGTERLDLWSLQLPKAAWRSDVDAETANKPQWVARQIDALIRERLEQEHLTPSPKADRRTLIRRLTFDLTGLPPTPEEVSTFLADTSVDAYRLLVDRLLASPRYGERQARLWLDVVRYADTHGYERDEFRPLAWKYRDYVIRSFNQDKPFGQFIREQLAGDELLTGMPQTAAESDMLIATGFLRLGQWDSTAAIFQEEERLRAEQMADLTNTTASAFLALTMSCCQCHDHKYDPLSQADHYRFRAFFAAVQPHDDFAVSVADEQRMIDQHNAEIERQAALLRTELDQLKPDAETDKVRREELQTQIADVEGKKKEPQRAMTATDSGGTAPATHIFYQGDFSAPREETLPGFVSVLFPGAATIVPPGENTTGRRLALANWVASSENPWTARVIVNRIWQQHFGTGIVATSNDFGYSGSRPTHPEILDSLAVEFMRQGWSVKELHRWIVNSETWRQRSFGDNHVPDIDQDNQLLWRQNARRLDAESLRDSLLAVSGLLLPCDGGRPLWPDVPDELTHAQPAILEALKNDDGGRMQGWYTDPIEQTDVRSIFLIRKRCLPIPFLQAFDLPETTVSCARRDTTVVAPQALMLLNSPEGLRYARAFAKRLAREESSFDLSDESASSSIVTSLFGLALNRDPDAEELALAMEFLKRHADRYHSSSKTPDFDALVDLCRAILNLNEFLYVD